MRLITWAQLLSVLLIFAQIWPSAAQDDIQADDINEDYWLTFLSRREGHNVLYKSRPDGTNLTPLLGGPIDSLPTVNPRVTMFHEPHWTWQSPDGTKFATWLYLVGQPASEWRGEYRATLCVGGMDGGWTHSIHAFSHEAIAWSPDSQNLAFSILSRNRTTGFLDSKTETTQIATCGFDGSGIDYIFEHEGIWVTMDWSPDGDHLLILENQLRSPLRESTSRLYELALVEMLADRSGIRGASRPGSEWTATHSVEFLREIECPIGNHVISGARYSPTGEQIALLMHDPDHLKAPNLLVEDPALQMMLAPRYMGKIAVFDRNAGASSIVAESEDGLRGPICWSPDGREIFFSRYLSADDDRENSLEDQQHGLSIWAVTSGGESERFVTTGWSPSCFRISPKTERE